MEEKTMAERLQQPISRFPRRRNTRDGRKDQRWRSNPMASCSKSFILILISPLKHEPKRQPSHLSIPIFPFRNHSTPFYILGWMPETWTSKLLQNVIHWTPHSGEMLYPSHVSLIVLRVWTNIHFLDNQRNCHKRWRSSRISPNTCPLTFPFKCNVQIGWP